MPIDQIAGSGAVYLAIALFIIIAIFKAVRIVPQSEKFVVERFGRLRSVLGPGINFTVPFLDRVAHKVSVLERQLPNARQDAISAANVTFRNILFTGGIDAIASVIVVSAADVAIVDCEYRDVTGECTVGILTTAAADRLHIRNLRYDGATSAGTSAGIAIVGGDRIVIEGLRMDGNFSVGGIDIRTTATTDLEVRDVVFRTRNSADIFLVDTITGSTGQIGPNLSLRVQDNAANITEAVTGATFVYFPPIYVVNLAGEQAMSSNITLSTDA